MTKGHDELVVGRDVRFQSLCQHHLLPLHGVAHLGYRPHERILGLSNLARVIELLSHTLQVQERLTAPVADGLQEHLQPKAVSADLEAEHVCM